MSDRWEEVQNPTCPADLPEHMPWYALTRFAQSCHSVIVNARGGSRVAPVETHLLLIVNLAGLADRARRGLWPAAIDAFNAGATRDRIAHALGLEPDEFDAGLRSFIRRERDKDPERAEGAVRLLAGRG